MMGPRQVAQGALFYEFSIEDHVPEDHLLRRIDRFLDLSDIRRLLAPHYSATGRPSVDPELMIRMLLAGYVMGVRSERRLCEEVHLNLGYRWFCRLDLTDPIPDHSTFSKNRHGRFRDSDLFSDREKAALAWTEEVTRHRNASDATFAELRKHFDERAIVELTWLNAVGNYYNLMAVPLGIESDGLMDMALTKAAH